MTLGLKDLYYAVCTEAEGAETYGAPKKMAEAMEADLSVKTETATFYKRKKDAKWKADFVGTEKDTPATTWFTAVPEPAPKMTAV